MNQLLCYKVILTWQKYPSEAKNSAPGLVYFSRAIEVEWGTELFCSNNPLDGLALQL